MAAKTSVKAVKTGRIVKLAIDGGPKVWPKPFPAWPQFDRKTDGKVLDILHSGKVNYWTGPVGVAFEAAWAKWLGVKNAVSVSNGSAALQIALEALEIGPGDEVICSGYSFIASSSCVLQCGAKPVFCDVGTDHLIDPKKIEPLVTQRTKAIVAVHLYGVVADMGPIMKIAKRHGLFVIEDCAQCIGGVYRGRKAGSIGTIGCFSFCQAKHFTTGGEGGMVCCNDDRLAWRARSLRDNGLDVRAKLTRRPSAKLVRPVYRRIGYNARMTEIQSAIGLGELARFDKWNLPRRKRLGKALVRGLAGHPLVKYLPVDTPERQNAWWLVPFVLDTARLKVPVTRFIQAVQAEGAGAYAILWPVMLGEDLSPRKCAKDCCETARAMRDATITFWVHPTYSPEHVQADIAAFNKVAAAYMRTPSVHTRER